MGRKAKDAPNGTQKVVISGLLPQNILQFNFCYSKPELKQCFKITYTKK